MSLLTRPFLTRAADELQDALEAPEPADARVDDLVATARAVSSLPVAGNPDPAFVAALGRRLQDEAALHPAPPAPQRRSGGPAPRPATRRPRPVVILIGRGLPRILAAALASVLAVVAIIGVVSRSSLPGQALYPVRELVDTASVSLSVSDHDKGFTLLAQARDHVVDTSRLTGGGSSVRGDVDHSLNDAIDAVTQGDQLLVADFAATRNPQSLLAIRQVAAQAAPMVDALQDVVPVGSRRLVAQLRTLLAQVGGAALDELAQCSTCGAAADAARNETRPAAPAQPSTSAFAGAPGGAAAAEPTATTRTTGTGSGTTAGRPTAGLAQPTVPLPTVPPLMNPALPGASGSPRSPSPPAPTIPGAGLPGATTSVGAVPPPVDNGATLPGISATATLPGIAATLPGATATASAGPR